jgi:ABC-2 type transport system ATP-binding protein
MADALTVEGLGKRFGAVVAVDGLGLAVAPGDCVGLLGPNGSGKSTTLQMLATLLRPDAGRVVVAGIDIARDPVAARGALGIVFQDSALDRGMGAEENLRFAAALHGLPSAIAGVRIAELLALFELDAKRKTPVAALSGGQRRALDIARGVLHRPRLLLLDEPTSGLDPANRRALWRFLHRLRREQGTALLVTTHLMDEAGDCDRVLFLRAGRCVGQGAPAALLAALGAFMLDVERGDGEPQELFPAFGRGLVQGDVISFRIADPGFALAGLDQAAVARARSLRLRRPDLNDAWLWTVAGLLEPRP